MTLCFSSCNLRLCSILAFRAEHKHQPTQTVPVVGGVCREALQRCIHGTTSSLGTAGTRKMLSPLKVCSTWKHLFSFFPKFSCLFWLCTSFSLPFSFYFPLISEVLKVCVYVNVYLHIAPCGCMHQVLCSTNPVSDLLLLSLN